MLILVIKSSIDIIIGAEAACCVGNPIKFRNKFIKHIYNIANNRNINLRWKFPNGGAIIGWADYVIKLLKLNQKEHDDQEGYYKLWSCSNPIFKLDVSQKLIGNIVHLDKYVCLLEEINYLKDIDYWHIDLPSRKIINKLTNEEPVLLHFPGKNKDYNKVGRLLYPEWFKYVKIK